MDKDNYLVYLDGHRSNCSLSNLEYRTLEEHQRRTIAHLQLESLGERFVPFDNVGYEGDRFEHYLVPVFRWVLTMPTRKTQDTAFRMQCLPAQLVERYCMTCDGDTLCQLCMTLSKTYKMICKSELEVQTSGVSTFCDEIRNFYCMTYEYSAFSILLWSVLWEEWSKKMELERN